MGTSNKSWVQVFNHIKSEAKQQKSKQKVVVDGGEERDTEMQLNDDVNGQKFVRPDVTSAGPPLLPEWAELREGKAGGREGWFIDTYREWTDQRLGQMTGDQSGVKSKMAIVH